MKKEIYIEVIDAIERYSSIDEYELFNILHEEINVFDKYVIENNLSSKIDEVLGKTSHQVHFSRSPIFDANTNLDFVDHFINYLEFRYFFDYLFIKDKSLDYFKDFAELKKCAIEDFLILSNRFLDSQYFYVYGRFDKEINNYPIENGIPANYVRLDGCSRTKMYALMLNGLRIAFIHKVKLADESLNCIFYGKLAFDPLLQINVINVSQFF